jgi:hypothetical protein
MIKTLSTHILFLVSSLLFLPVDIASGQSYQRWALPLSRKQEARNWNRLEQAFRH